MHDAAGRAGAGGPVTGGRPTGGEVVGGFGALVDPGRSDAPQSEQGGEVGRC